MLSAEERASLAAFAAAPPGAPLPPPVLLARALVALRDAGAAEAQFGLGEALRAAGRTAEAVAAFQRYLEIAPGGPDAETAKNAIAALQ